MQAVQFRWEKVRMKYAKLMKQATPQPGLIGTAPAEGPVEALEMDAEAAELAAALQMYGKGSHVRVPRGKAGAAAAAQRTRSSSPSSTTKGAPAAAAAADPSARQGPRTKRQGGVQGVSKTLVEDATRGMELRGSPSKKLCSTPSQRQQQQQQQQQLVDSHQQLTASQWALLQQHLQLPTSHSASTSKTASPVWAESEQGPPPACSPALSPAGPPPQKAALLTRRELEEALIKSEPEKGISGEHSLSELDLKMQLLLQVAMRLQQQSTEQQDSALMMQTFKALVQYRQERQEEVTTGPLLHTAQQQQQQQGKDRGGTTDLESGLLRLVANSAGRLGGARGGAVRGSELRALSGSKEGASSHDIASVLGMREVSPLSAKQSWGEAPADQGFVEGLNTLTRFLADENRSLSTAAADAAARGGGVIGLTNWVTSPLTQSTRSGGESCNGTPGGPVFGAERESFEGPLAEDGVDLQPWRRAVCVILEDVLENCILEVGSQPREGGSMSLERLQFAPMVGRLKALAARSCSKAELRPFLRLFSRSIRLGLVPSKQSEDVQQLILDALGALDDALAASRAPPPLALATRGHLDSVDTPSPFTLLPAGSGFS
ncbi:uncharacterized protein LOC34619788 [Cyclospora cayetanensis]|uniref:Uncharacterized protein LOC34619788 n=1 Tax=Cyclospora cayetanensis TaxID=88456 RepID=A0A6P6S4K8_9EIME|nr:uncharacterized protein LOC34619788 [Cyclospora cayetanensis]